METTLISIITATYNSESTLQQTIDSVLAQKNKNFEHIIIDGKSTDGTIKIIEKNKERYINSNIAMSYLSEKDNGIFDAWNKGITMAKGQWLMFLGSDDRLFPATIDTYVKEVDSKLDFITGKAKFTQAGQFVRNYGEVFSWQIFKKEMKILHSGGIHNSKYFQEYGEFDTNFKITGDYEMLLRKGEALNVKFIDQFVIDMEVGGASSGDYKKALQEAMKAKLKHKARGPLEAKVDYWLVLSKVFINRLLNR